MNYHLAQTNIAIAKYGYDDPRFAGVITSYSIHYTKLYDWR